MPFPGLTATGRQKRTTITARGPFYSGQPTSRRQKCASIWRDQFANHNEDYQLVSAILLGSLTSISRNLREYPLNELAFRRSVTLSVEFESFGKLAFHFCISSGIGGMPAKPVAKGQLRRVRRRANVDVVRSTTTKGRHTFDEKHSVGPGIFCPMNVAKTRKRGNQPWPNRDL